MRNKLLKRLLKTLLTAILLLHVSNYAKDEFVKPAYDARLNNYTDAKAWYDSSDKLSDSAFNLGVTYHKKIKDYKQAEFWYLQAYRLNKKDADIPNDLGYLYDDIKEYDKAIKWYKKTYELKEASGVYNLAYLYEDKLHKYNEAIKWYEVSIKKENLKAMKNLAYLYHTVLKDDVESTQYYLALIDNRFPKEQVLNFLRNNYHFSEATLKKGYELQLKSKIILEELKYKDGL